MCRLGSVPEAHKFAGDDGGIVLEIIFSAKNCANQTIRIKVTLLKFGYSSVTKFTCLINPRNKLGLETQGEILI